MQTLIRAAVVLAFAGTLFACKPKPEPVAVAEEAPAEEAEEGSSEHLLEACTIKITEPEQVSWTTYWDAESLASGAENPSSARSAYWANEEERKTLAKTNSVEPLTIRCSSDESPNISISFSWYSSPLATVPLNSGEYPIVGDGDPEPGQFKAGSVIYRSAHDRADYRLALVIDRFDMDGVRGSFRMDGKEEGEDGAEFRFEGTFDIPCRGGPLESACEPNSPYSPEARTATHTQLRLWTPAALPGVTLFEPRISGSVSRATRMTSTRSASSPAAFSDSTTAARTTSPAAVRSMS